MRFVENILLLLAFLILTFVFLTKTTNLKAQINTLKAETYYLQQSIERLEDITVHNGLWIIDWNAPLRWNNKYYSPDLRWKNGLFSNEKKEETKDE